MRLPAAKDEELGSVPSGQTRKSSEGNLMCANILVPA